VRDRVCGQSREGQPSSVNGVSQVARHGPPAASRPVVVRPRLLEAIQGRFDRRVTALVAGPGFGKSILLGQAVAENQLAPRGIDVWVGCSADDAAVSVLAWALLSRLGADPETALPTEAMADPRAAAQRVADAVWSQAPTQIALVLDDAHAVPRNSPGHRLVLSLVEMLPANGHLVLAFRPPITLPLARLLAVDQAVVLGESELSFSEHELAEFAAQRRVATELLDGVGGWPALAELTATVGQRHVVDYIWQEVLEGISDEQRHLLATLASVGGADDALASELLGTSIDLRAALDDFPLASATPEGWWSLHPLWEKALLPLVDPKTMVEARRRAAATLRQRGFTRESMRLLMQAEAWDDVRDLVVEVCSGLTPMVHADLLAQWRDSLPEKVRRTPEGLLLAATAIKAKDPRTSSRLLQEAGDNFRTSGNTRGEMACLLSLFQIAFWRGDARAEESILLRWDKLAADGNIEAEAAAVLGRALLAADPAQAQAELDRLPSRPPGPMAPIADWLRAHILLLTLGDPEHAEAWARQALPKARSTLRSSIRCELVESLRLMGRVEEADREATALLDELGSGDVRSPRHLTVVVVLRAFLGRVAEAQHLLAELQSVADSSHIVWAPIAAAVGEAACAVATGNEARAAQLLRGVIDHSMARQRVLLRICPASLPLYYVLVPESRAEWDRADLRGAFAVAHRLAKAVVALREGRSDVAVPVEATDLKLAPAYLPVPWTAELGLGLAARGRPEGEPLVQTLGSSARSTLRTLEATAHKPVAEMARRMLARIPALPRHTLRVWVLGPLLVLRDGDEVDDPNLRRERVRQLLGLLVVYRRTSRNVAAAALWPDLEEADAARNLRVTLNYLQRVLEPDRDERDAPFFLRAKGTMLELTNDAALEVDMWEFERDLQEAERAIRHGAPSVALTAQLRAVRRYRGDLLSDLPQDEWSSQERERLRRRYVATALSAGNLLLARGDHHQPEELATRALAAEPWSEEAYQLLAATLLARGDRAAARRALDHCFDMLAELGVEAEPRTLNLIQQVRRGGR
jgi:LuxR family transcriptional regulator, maltose regulon positive regulatory protein